MRKSHVKDNMKLAIHSISLIYNFMQSKAVDDKETHRLFFSLMPGALLKRNSAILHRLL